jgi:NTP pyrophosphatase (non-canonical NTP hydrolase)
MIYKVTGVSEIDCDINEELQRAIEKFPQWPTDPVHAVAVVQEECGELVREVLQRMYSPGLMIVQNENIRNEAIQSLAMLVRFLRALDDGKYDWTPAKSHDQGLLRPT